MLTIRIGCAAACLAVWSGTALVQGQTSPADILAEIKALRERLAHLEKQVEATKPPPTAVTVSPNPPETSAVPLPPPEGAPAKTPSAEPVFSAGPIEFSGVVDSYYSLNFNHPASRSNQLRNFDTNANQFSLNMAKLTMQHQADPVGFRVDLGLGPAFDIVHSTEPGGLGPLRYIQQAYVTYNAKVGKGLTLDMGKFVTIHGAEVIETLSNWNYSRSLMFAYAIPYYHFGLRATYPLHKTFTGSFHLLNGWNNVVDNNSGKTYGFQGIWTPNGYFSLTSNYMFGPEKNGTNRGYRHLSDTVAAITVNAHVSFLLNYDYAIDKFDGGGKARWTGVAGYARLAPNKWFAFIPRIEWYNDADGFTTGVAQKLKEATITAEFKMKEGLMSRFEYRRDWSDRGFFDRGNSPASSKSQDTLLAGFIVYFGPKR